MRWALAIVFALAACGKKADDPPEKIAIDPVPTSSAQQENTKQKPLPLPASDAIADAITDSADLPIGHGASPTGNAPAKDPYAVGATRFPGRRAVIPHVALGAFKVTGALPPEVVPRIVRRYVPQFQYCYEKTLRDNPQLKGQATFHFTIAPTGAVTGADVKKSLHPDVDVCIADRLRALEFPKPEHDAVQVEAPMTFSVLD